MRSKSKMQKRFRALYLGCTLAIALPMIAAAEAPPAQRPVIGLLTWASCDGPSDAPGLGEFGPLARGLRELGRIPGETITILCRSAKGRYEDFPKAVTELIRLHVDVIVTSSQAATSAAAAKTHTVPVVGVSDSPSLALITAITAPEINVTGVITSTLDLVGKRLELLKEATPALTSVAVLSNPSGFYRAFETHARRAAGELGLTVTFYRVSKATDLETAFARMKAEGAAALVVSPDLMFESETSLIGKLAVQNRIPTIGWDRRMTEAGCLLAYSGREPELQYRLASYVDRVLKGVWPGDLPMEQAARFWLSVNLRTAKVLDIVVPPSVLLMADEVIE